MKNKSTLVMTEYVVMLLVFALATTVCVRMFVLSEKLSRTYEATDRAVLVAQNAAELLKKGGLSEPVTETGTVESEDTIRMICYDRDWNVTEEALAEYVTEVRYEEKSEYLFRAEIVVLTADGEELFRLPVAGQKSAEVTGYEAD